MPRRLDHQRWDFGLTEHLERLQPPLIDTTSASGELVLNIFSALAQFERRLIQERTRAGLDAARARGRVGGRPRIDSTDPRVATARTLHRDRSLSIEEICSTLRVSRSTLYRWLSIDDAAHTLVSGDSA
ncbi:MAG: recombinase family protein [Planctomycetota bacterium]